MILARETILLTAIPSCLSQENTEMMVDYLTGLAVSFTFSPKPFEIFLNLLDVGRG